nr:hydroxylaminobenzene mutase HabB [uncultured bacterium]
MTRRLCRHGVLLFLFGLLTGAAVPAFANPRMALSAHVGAEESGMFLMLLGLVWDHLCLGHSASRITFLLASGSLYVIWLGLVLAAVLGTSEATPIAGAGHHGAPWAEQTVSALLTIGSVAIIGATLAVLRGLRDPARSQ